MVTNLDFLREDVLFLLKEEIRNTLIDATQNQLDLITGQGKGIVVSNSMNIDDVDDVDECNDASDLVTKAVLSATHAVCEKLAIELKEISEIAESAISELTRAFNNEALLIEPG